VREPRLVEEDISPVSDPANTCDGALVWDIKTGWISWQRSDGNHLVRICWLSLERRGKSFTSYNTTAAIAAQQGEVTILDFSDVIAMLKSVDETLFK
jgi:hypothetical protein